jgi:uncharacterized protein
MLTEDKIYSLHQKYSHGKFKNQILDLVWTHSLIVKEISLQITNKLIDKYQINVDLELLTAGALIHDLGFYKCFDDDFNKTEKYILHSQFGYELCHQENIPENLARFCLVHNGIGIYPNIPITLEEEIVTYGDCFHSKSYPNYKTLEDIKKMLVKYRSDDSIIIDRLKNKFEIPDLIKLKRKYEQWHLKTNKWLKSIK